MTPPATMERVKSPRTDLPTCSQDTAGQSGSGSGGDNVYCSSENRPIVKGPSGGSWSSKDYPDKQDGSSSSGISDSSSGSDSDCGGRGRGYGSDGRGDGSDACDSIGGSGGGGGGAGGGGAGGLGGSETDGTKMKIYALLAALGLGGLVGLTLYFTFMNILLIISIKLIIYSFGCCPEALPNLPKKKFV